MELGFLFNDEGRKFSPRCDFCRGVYVPDVQIEFGTMDVDSFFGESEICPSRAPPSLTACLTCGWSGL